MIIARLYAEHTCTMYILHVHVHVHCTLFMSMFSPFLLHVEYLQCTMYMYMYLQCTMYMYMYVRNMYMYMYIPFIQCTNIYLTCMGCVYLSLVTEKRNMVPSTGACIETCMCNIHVHVYTCTCILIYAVICVLFSFISCTVYTCTCTCIIHVHVCCVYVVCILYVSCLLIISCCREGIWYSVLVGASTPQVYNLHCTIVTGSHPITQ